jgi:hypothetical protein
MKTIQEALLLENPEEIKREIEERQSLSRQMVGWLYPSVLADETDKLSDRLAEIRTPVQRKVVWQG